nr:MAG TPA: hypothetical protein [Caudoviricetes sp.]
MVGRYISTNYIYLTCNTCNLTYLYLFSFDNHW